MTLLSPKEQDKNKSNKADYAILPPVVSNFDMLSSPSSLISLSSADYTAGGTLDPHISKRTQKTSTLIHSNQYFADGGDANSSNRKNLVRKFSKMQQFFDDYHESTTKLEIEIADKQQEIDKLDTLLRIKSEAEESLKEQIWNLELKNQDLQQQINQLNSNSAKLLTEQSRLECENETLEQELENLKMMQQTNEAKIKKIQQDHDHETHQLKRVLHNLKKEETELNKQLESVIAEKSAAGQALFQSNNINQANTKLMEGQFIAKHTKDAKSDLEANILKASLENAHIMIRTLEKQIQDEAVERREVDQLLAEAQETIENYRSSAHGNLMKSPNSQINSPSDNSHNRHTQSKPLLGQSLGDELYHFFNSSTFERHVENGSNASKTHISKYNHKKSSDLKRESDSSSDSNSISSEIETLTLDARSSTKSISERAQQVEQIEKCEKGGKEEFGSLIKDPESYIYTPAPKGNTNTKKEERVEGDGHHNLEIESHFKRSHSLTRAKNDNGYLRIQQQQQQQQQQQHRQNNSSSDKPQLTAIYITMAGNWVWKYKRRAIGNTISNNKHRRFVWIHPCSRTLCWSVIEPGSQGAEYRTKSALIESYVVLDNNQDKSVTPSILIKTSVRGIQIQCFDLKSHSIWCMSLRYLLMEGGTGIDKETSQWLDDIIRPALGKRGLDTKVNTLLYSSQSEKQDDTSKNSSTF